MSGNNIAENKKITAVQAALAAGFWILNHNSLGYKGILFYLYGSHVLTDPVLAKGKIKSKFGNKHTKEEFVLILQNFEFFISDN